MAIHALVPLKTRSPLTLTLTAPLSTQIAVGAMVGAKVIPWSDELVLVGLTLGLLALGRTYALPVIRESLNESRQAIKSEVMSGKASLDTMKKFLDTHIR